MIPRACAASNPVADRTQKVMAMPLCIATPAGSAFPSRVDFQQRILSPVRNRQGHYRNPARNHEAWLVPLKERFAKQAIFSK